MGRPTKEEIEQARRDSAASKAAEEKAYMESLTSTAPAPKEEKDVRAPIRGQKGYAKGGMASASKRADGIAERGKTRGTMVMCGGGYMKGKK